MTAPQTHDPDRDLVRRARAGDFDAFEQLVERFQRPIYGLAMRILQNRADAEEAVQESFLSVVEHLAGFQENSTFYTWLVRIATNHALKILAKRKRRRALPLEAPDDEELPHPQFIAEWREDPSAIAQNAEARALIEKALAELDEKYRVVFVLRDVEGMSTEETAGVLGIGISNVKVRLLRARLMLRERLTRELGDEATKVEAHEH